MRRLLIQAFFLCGTITLGGCSLFTEERQANSREDLYQPTLLDRLPLIYRPTIQQGNVVTQEQVNQLEPGMSRRQVQFILGSPTLQDAFHADRWDYPFTKGVGSKPNEFRYFTVFFEDDRLVRMSGDLHPQPLAERKPVEKPPVVKVPDWTPESKSLIGRLLDSVDFSD